MLAKGADVNLQNNNGWTALMYAAKDDQTGIEFYEEPNLELMKLLIEREADMAGIHALMPDSRTSRKVCDFLGPEEAYKAIRFFNQEKVGLAVGRKRLAKEQEIYDTSYDSLASMESVTDIERSVP